MLLIKRDFFLTFQDICEKIQIIMIKELHSCLEKLFRSNEKKKKKKKRKKCLFQKHEIELTEIISDH